MGVMGMRSATHHGARQGPALVPDRPACPVSLWLSSCLWVLRSGMLGLEAPPRTLTQLQPPEGLPLPSRGAGTLWGLAAHHYV